MLVPGRWGGRLPFGAFAESTATPFLRCKRAKSRSVHREIFTPDERNAILASNPELRDKLALRLLLDYGLRKGALQRVQFKHFDHHRKRLTIFTKGAKIRHLPIPQPGFWFDLERVILEEAAEPHEYLLPRQKAIPRKGVMVMHRFASNRWASTGCTTGGTAAFNRRESSRPASPQASACTRPATRRVSACWT